MKIRPALSFALLALPVLARAHPGHDGDHDFVWDFQHLATHPIATLSYLAIGCLVAALVWRRVRAPKSEARHEHSEIHRR